MKRAHARGRRGNKQGVFNGSAVRTENPWKGSRLDEEEEEEAS
jgi:hypothetical protein